MILDLHCDTFLRMYIDKKDIDSFKDNEYSIDINKLKKGNVLAQCFAIFNDKKSQYVTADMYDKIDYMFNVLNHYEDDISIYSGYNSLLENKNSGKICAIPTIEDVGPILGDMSHIDKLHSMGFKIISITWNFENTLGYPNSTDANIMSKGLKDFGIDAVKRMNELSMIIDVSHLSDGGFYDVAKHSSRPFVATHSNARAVTNHTRNLTDDMIKILSDAGGVMGINFCHKFLCSEGKLSKVSDMIAHIQHIKNVGGIDCIAIGSDFDGISSDLEIKDSSQLYMLTEALESAGFSQDDIEKITYKNALRVLKDSD